MKTLVKFYIEPFRDILAVFPELKEANGYRTDLMTCYSHVGQHSVCAPEYLKRCRKAKAKEYNDLKQELESIGYDLKLTNKQKTTK